MTRTAFLAVAALLIQNPPPPQPDVRPGVIIGQVVDAEGGRGVRQAIVRLAGAGLSVTRVADDRGRFFFRGLPAGSYRITATRDGYFEGAFGRVRAGGDPLDVPLAAGQWKTDVTIELFRPAVIHGAVDDEANEPLAGIRVRAFRLQWSGGRELWLPDVFTETDDQGLYRLFGLMPGEYVVALPSVQVTMPMASMEEVGQTGRSTRDLMAVLSMNGGPGSLIGSTNGATSGLLFNPDDRNLRIPGSSATPPEPPDGSRLAYPTVFYPSADGPETAVRISVGPGEERPGVSFTIRPVPAVRVSGRLEGPEGPVAGLMLRLVRDGAQDFGLGAETAATISAPDGSFTLVDVPAGFYRLSARAAAGALSNWQPTGIVASAEGRAAGTLAGPEEFWGEVPVTVYDEDVGDIVVTADRGVTISGRVVFETQGEPVAQERAAVMRLVVESAEGGDADVPPAPVSKEAEFAIAGLRPGRYTIRAEALPPGWHLKSVVWAGRDAARDPLEVRGDISIEDVLVTLVDRPTRISGSVYDTRGLAVPGARVVAVPAGRGSGIDRTAPAAKVRSVRANVFGNFEMVGLPPGAYDLIAMPEEANVAWQDPAVLARLAGEVARVTVAEGQMVQRAIRSGGRQGPLRDGP